MKIHNECSFLKPEGVAKVEELYKAKFVMESCVKSGRGGWSDFPVAIFYTEEAHPQGSNYFGLYTQRDYKTGESHFMITNGISATEPFQGIRVGDNVYYSRYCHDYRQCGKVAIDGGRDYTRLVGDIDSAETVMLHVVKDKLEVMQ
jgi:hypothetical protein